MVWGEDTNTLLVEAQTDTFFLNLLIVIKILNLYIPLLEISPEETPKNQKDSTDKEANCNTDGKSKTPGIMSALE